jgi:transcription initiation factor TFIIB
MLKNEGFEPSTKPVCNECNGQILWDQESGEHVCTGCGAVTRSAEFDFLIPPSRRAMESALSQNPMAAVVRDDLDLPTVVGHGNVDAHGRPLGQNHEMKQLRKLSAVVSWDPRRRKMARVSTEIRRVAESLGLGNTVSVRAYEIYMKSFDSKVAKATSVTAAAAAAVCVACLELEIPRPSDETVALKANVDERKIRQHYKVLVKNTSAASIPNPAIYVPAIAARASLGGLTERKALELLTKIKGSDVFVGKRPVSIAAAALYLASVENHDPITQMRIAFAAGVSPITVRKRSSEIAQVLGMGFEEIALQ